MWRILYERALPANGSSRNAKTGKILKRVPATMALVGLEGQLFLLIIASALSTHLSPPLTVLRGGARIVLWV